MKNKKMLGIIVVLVTFIVIGIFTFIYLIFSEKIVCDEGYIVYKNKCAKEIIIDADISKYCDDEYEMIDDRCIKIELLDSIQYSECPDGYSLKNNICEKYINPTKKYSCPANYNLMSDQTCSGPLIIKDDATWWSIGVFKACKTENTRYYGGNDCMKIVQTNAIEKLTCSIGKLVNNKCYLTAKAEVGQTCLDGYKLEENICKKSVEGEKYYNYSCSKEYKLDGTKCIGIEEPK